MIAIRAIVPKRSAVVFAVGVDVGVLLILPMALKSSSEELKEHILGNMSGRAADMIREDMEVLGPVTVKRVLEAQETIVDSILRMADEGKVNLNPEDSV